MDPNPEERFDELVRSRTGSDFVEREWLNKHIEQACADPRVRYVLVTGEPGAGKTSLAAGLARKHPQWLRYFVRGDSLSRPQQSGPVAFLLAIGHQLARRRPALFETERLQVLVEQRVRTVAPGGRVVGVQVDHLTVSPFRLTAHLAVEQRIGENAGEVVGVAAASMTVDPRLEKPEILAPLALIDPARLLAQDDPQARIVLLVDGIDELASAPGGTELLDWLAAGPDLPPNVRVVLTSRPHEVLERFRLGRPDGLVEIRIDPASRQVATDLAAYAERTVLTPPVVELVQAQGTLAPDDFVRRLVRQAEGNFQYLAAYQRALDDARGRGDEQEVSRLLSFDDLPTGLHALYGVLMTTMRADLVRLGSVAGGADASQATRLDAWRDVGRPVLGVLAVAREPLAIRELTELAGVTAPSEAVGDVLRRLRWLLDMRDGRAVLFHASLAEFLTGGDPADPDGPSWAVDEKHWHARIVRHYRGDAASWDEVDWSAASRYGLIHLAWHVLGAPDAIKADAVGLVGPGLRRAILTAFGSDRHFLSITQLLAGHAANALPLAEALPAVLFLGVTRRQLLRTVRNMPPVVIGLMVRMGRVEEALEHMRALLPSVHQVQAIREILRYLPERQRQQPDDDLIELLAEVAVLIEDTQSLYLAAQLLAPRDLDRALRLWRRGRDLDRAPWRTADAPNAVYRTAAEAADPDVARQYIALMREGRCAAYLDLAARAPSDAVPELLDEAERNLSAVPLDERLESGARLAVARLPHDAERAAAHLAAVVAEVDRELAAFGGKPAAAAGNKIVEPLANGLAAAAVALRGEPEYRDKARALLDRLDRITVSGLVDDAFMRAMDLWLEWGEEERADSIQTRTLSWNGTLWTHHKIAKVLQRHDPARAASLMDGAYADRSRAPKDGGMMARVFGDSDDRTMALYLADKDPRRAVEAAERIAVVTWSEVGDDRYTTLARIAHVQLDRGRAVLAAPLLDEALHHAETPPPLTDGNRGGGPYRRGQAPAGPADFRDIAGDAAYLFNIDQAWQQQRRQRFFQDPADVVRAAMPGPMVIGAPHSWARTLRTIAEATATHDQDAALLLVHALEDYGEMAVGLAALAAEAWRRRDRTRAERLWRNLNSALRSMPTYSWNAQPQDDYAYAYLRPDHRARFDAATRTLPWNADRGFELLQQTGAPYLQYAYQFSFGSWASGVYSSQIMRDGRRGGGGHEPDVYESMHRMLLEPPPGKHDPLIVGIANARAAINERLISSALQRRAPAGLGARIQDEVCAAYAAMVPDGNRGLGPAFAQRIRALLDTVRLPAAAALCAFAARMVSPNDPVLRELIAAVRADAARASHRHTYILTELCFAAEPATAALVDLPALTKEIAALPPGFGDDYGALRRDLFAVLVERNPPEALRLLSHALEGEWELAMAMLEQAADTLVRTLGVHAGTVLHESLVRALRCSSPSGTERLPDIDGVLTKLASQ